MTAVSGDKRAKAITILMRRLLVTLRNTHLSSGICIMIDNANNLDSASEQLLLDLATQLPWLLFIFAGRRTDEPCSLKQQLIPFKNAAEREKEIAGEEAGESSREGQQAACTVHPSPGKHGSRTTACRVAAVIQTHKHTKHHTMPRPGRSQPQLNNDENAGTGGGTSSGGDRDQRLAASLVAAMLQTSTDGRRPKRRRKRKRGRRRGKE